MRFVNTSPIDMYLTTSWQSTRPLIDRSRAGPDRVQHPERGHPALSTPRVCNINRVDTTLHTIESSVRTKPLQSPPLMVRSVA